MSNKKEIKRDRFIRVAETRTQKVLDDLHSLSKCAAPESYDYSPEDLKQILAAVEKKLAEVKDIFAGNHRFSLNPVKTRYEKDELEKIIMALLCDNDPNLSTADSGYDKGYAEGYHDALVDVMQQCSIETDEEYYN